MILGLLAISGMLAETLMLEPREPAITAVEVSYATHAGEGAEGRKRFTPDGCYQVESGGSTGGSAYASDSQAGCHLPSDVAAVFAKLAAIPSDALEREQPARARGTGGAPRNGMAGFSETYVVVIKTNGSRWVAANKATADDILRAVNELPSENQWYAKPPEKPAGTGAQLLVVSFGSPQSRTQASLTSEGRWWCYRSLIGPRTQIRKLPAKPARPLPAADAIGRLGRILRGARSAGSDDGATAADKRADRSETAEAMWPGQTRAPLRSKIAPSVISRFADEMQSMAPACPQKAVE
jgi:hypothetical protein